MLKKYFFAVSSLILAAGMSAATLTPEAALHRAISSPSARKAVRNAGEPRLVSAIDSRQGSPAVYLFNRPEGGVLFVSASDKALPLLGYTDSGSFNEASMAPELQAWLESYADQIAWAEANGINIQSKEITDIYPSEWEYIAPMVKTQWNQGKPFNGDIPDTYYATGCVATAMAQVMNYWQYPAVGYGSHSYSYQGPYGLVDNSIDFSAKPFQWDLMLPRYTEGKYTDAQAAAVAYLMKACGFAVNTIYGASSGARVELIPGALVDYFGYDGSIRHLQRFGYTASEWATILYDQLKNVGPVLYNGTSQAPGEIAHAFVCDGYDGNGYFHINWGWSGLSDGFFALDAFTPPVQSTGGGSGGYIFSQGMVVDIKKGEGTPSYELTPSLALLGNISAEIGEDGVMTIRLSQANPGNIVNTSAVDIMPAYGVHIEGTGFDFSEDLEILDVFVGGKPYDYPTLPPGASLYQEVYFTLSLDSPLPDGRYEVSLIWEDIDGAPGWNEFVTAPGSNPYFYLNVAGGNYEVENLAPNRFIIESAEVLTPVYMRNPCQIEFTLTNPTDYELTQSICPVLYYEGKLSFKAQVEVVTVGAGETVKKSMFYTFEQQTGGTAPTPSKAREYTLGAFDYSVLLDENYMSGNYDGAYYGDLTTVMMYRPDADLNPDSFRLVSISIDNADAEGAPYDNVVGINDFNDIQVSVTLEGTGQFLSTPLTAEVREYDMQSRTAGDMVYEKTFENLIYVKNGETGSSSTVIDMPSYNIGDIYSLSIYYMYQKERKLVGSLLFGASTGVDSPVVDFAGVREVYDLTGKRIPVDNLSSLPKGIYIVRTGAETVKIIR